MSDDILEHKAIEGMLNFAKYIAMVIRNAMAGWFRTGGSAGIDHGRIGKSKSRYFLRIGQSQQASSPDPTRSTRQRAIAGLVRHIGRLPELADVVEVMFQQRDTFETKAESVAADSFWIVASLGQRFNSQHATTGDLQPSSPVIH